MVKCLFLVIGVVPSFHEPNERWNIIFFNDQWIVQLGYVSALAQKSNTCRTSHQRHSTLISSDDAAGLAYCSGPRVYSIYVVGELIKFRIACSFLRIPTYLTLLYRTLTRNQAIFPVTRTNWWRVSQRIRLSGDEPRYVPISPSGDCDVDILFFFSNFFTNEGCVLLLHKNEYFMKHHRLWIWKKKYSWLHWYH